MNFVEILGLVSSVALPFFNLPLMRRLYKRKSSEDLSLVWLFGIFFSLVGMLPLGLQSTDKIFRLFSILNLAFFSGVVYLTLYYRMKKKP